MITRFFTLTLLFFFAIAGRAQPHDRSCAIPTDSATCSLISYTDYELEQDSLQASSDVMVPFRSELIRAARRHQVPAALLAAFCQEESGFNPWAERSEPKYWRNAKVKRESVRWSRSHGGLPTATTELSDRAKSMGLMQPMGEVAREQGYDSTYLSSLFEPFNSIDQGAILLKKLLTKYGRDTLAAISAYNQGSPRQLHGTFANARYVYRVSAAWRHYQTILYAQTTSHKESRYMARRDRDTTRDRGLAPSALPNKDSSGAQYVKSDASGLSAFAYRYDPGPRYPVCDDLSPGESESAWQRYRDAVRDGTDTFFWCGFAFLAVCLFGLVAMVARYERSGTRYDLGVPRQTKRHVLRRARFGTSGAYHRGSFPVPGFDHHA